MLAWTTFGAVGRPRTLQMRLQPVYAGRVRAGAPVPTRAMRTDEAVANLRFFTAAGPRVVPVDTLVVSGAGGRTDVPEVVATARERGIATVTLHADVGDLGGAPPPVDRLVLPLPSDPEGLARASAGIARCRAVGIEVTANLELSVAAIPELDRLVAAALGCARVGFTYPFPAADGDPPPLGDTLRALARGVAAVEAAGGRAWVKGLPACYLGDLARLLHRSANRWYVDAEHQEARALMFFPDVVAFSKDDSCRFCAADGRCDGYFEAHLRRPGHPPLRAIDPAPA